MPNRQDLPTRLAKARQQLQKAQSRVAALEARIFEEQSEPVGLAISEDFYRRMLDNMLDGCQIIGFDWRYLYINDAAARHERYTRDELLGYTMMERHPGIELTPMFAVLQRCMRTRSVERLENEVIYPDGSSAWFDLLIQPVSEGIFILSRAITERKAQERQLRYQAALQENMSDAVIVTDMNLHIQGWNRAAERIYGWSEEEVLGRTSGDLLRTEFALPGEYERVIEKIQARSWYQAEVSQYRKDDSRLSILGSVTVIEDENGQPQGIIAVNRDITELKQAQQAIIESEARYRLLAENLADVIMTFSMDRRITYVSPSCEKLLGYRSEEVEGKSQDEFIHPEDYPSVVGRTRQAVISKEHSYTNQFRIRHKAGHYIWYEVRTRLVLELNTDNVVQFVSVLRDITERKQAEDALRESEEKFRLLLDAAPVATIISDQEGRINLVNVQAESLFGYKRSELIGKKVEVLVPARARDSHVDNRVTYIAAPRVRPMGLGMELYARHQDGHEIPVEIELSYVNTHTGIMVMSFILDITERKRIASELEQQRSFLRNVIDVSPGMIFVKDYDGRFVLVNPSVADLYNTTVDALIGKKDADFNPIQQEIDAILRADRQVITSGELLFIEEPITSFTGKTRWLETTKVPIVSADGKSKYVLGVSTDITKRREAEEALRASEEKYRSLVETMGGGLVVFDTEFRVTYVNDRFCELLGYSVKEITGKHPEDFVDTSDIPLLRSHLEGRQNTENAAYEIPLRHKDGHPIYMLLSGSPLFDKQGKHNGSIIVATDISIQKQAEAMLRQTLAREKELGDLKTRFVSMASHEFRTPLATILALVETLSAYRDRLSEAQIEQRFNRIKDQISHLKNIMEDVLMLARIQVGRVEFNPVRLDLDALVRSVLDEFESRFDISHRLEYTVDKGSHDIVLLDRKLMRQIISNLVSNAIKYSPEGLVVRINLEYTDSTIILSVSDDGIGIPPADLPHLFEPFHRAANVGTIPGTGLGMVITREAVELHDGTITVESQPNIGTTFIIRIPVATEVIQKNDENA